MVDINISKYIHDDDLCQNYDIELLMCISEEFIMYGSFFAKYIVSHIITLFIYLCWYENP